MGSQDALFSGSIFRKDNPIILACRRDLAAFMGARLVYSAYDYMPGQALVRVTSTGLFDRWSNASGGTYDSPCVLFDQVTNPAQQENSAGGTLSGVSGSTLARALIKGIVYTANLIDADSGFKTALKSIDRFDSAATQLTTF
jgi:hypothetical protein